MTDQERTVWCGNLSPNVTEEILYELFYQVGPIEKIDMPKDRDGRPRTFAFIVFKHECSVQYALGILFGTSLFGRQLMLNNKGAGSQQGHPGDKNIANAPANGLMESTKVAIGSPLMNNSWENRNRMGETRERLRDNRDRGNESYYDHRSACSPNDNEVNNSKRRRYANHDDRKNNDNYHNSRHRDRDRDRERDRHDRYHHNDRRRY